MKTYKVLALPGGISKDSLTKRLYGELVKHNTTGLEFQTYDIASVPFFSQDIEYNPPKSVVELQDSVRQADAVLFITPEYNRSFPGVLKNAIDWCSRPWGSNLWATKPGAIMSASIGKIGGFGAQQHLKNVCAFLDIRVMNQPEYYFDASGSMNEKGMLPDSIVFLQNYLKSFEQWIANKI